MENVYQNGSTLNGGVAATIFAKRQQIATKPKLTYKEIIEILKLSREKVRSQLIEKILYTNEGSKNYNDVRELNFLQQDNTTAVEKAYTEFVDIVNGYLKDNQGRLERVDVSNCLQELDYIRAYCARKVKIANVEELFKMTTKVNRGMQSCSSNLVEVPDVDLYIDKNEKNLYLVLKNVPNKYDINAYINNNSKPLDAGVAISYIPNGEERIVKTKSGNDRLALDSVQLCRYDPYQKDSHGNTFRQYDKECVDMAREVFKDRAAAPHFHFCSLNDTKYFKETARANAINIYDLINYVQKLQDSKQDDPIRTYNLGMPFTTILERPSLYVTMMDDLDELAARHVKNKDLVDNVKLTKQLAAGKEKLMGLDAVLADLTMIALLHDNPDKKWESVIDEQNYAAKLCAGGTIERVFEKTEEKQEETEYGLN